MRLPDQNNRIRAAIRNNVRWCDTVCRAHGVPGEFHESMWVNRNHVPPYHPNLITLSDGKDSDVQCDAIRSLLGQDIAPTWSIKDSLACLDLRDLGFEPLFAATWLWRSPETPLPPQNAMQITWSRVSDAAALAAWEGAWRGNDANTLTGSLPRLFVPALVQEKEVEFFAGRADDTILAVGIANRTGEVVGLSNVFARVDLGGSHWAGCVAAVQASFPGMPIVGYERGEDLSAAKHVGFEPLHPLTVWIRAPRGAECPVTTPMAR